MQLFQGLGRQRCWAWLPTGRERREEKTGGRHKRQIVALTRPLPRVRKRNRSAALVVISREFGINGAREAARASGKVERVRSFGPPETSAKSDGRDCA